jgi:hypothetical protein
MVLYLQFQIWRNHGLVFERRSSRSVTSFSLFEQEKKLHKENAKRIEGSDSGPADHVTVKIQGRKWLLCTFWK